MRIGIDAYPLARDGAGISNYVFNIVKHLECIDTQNEYYLYSCPGIKLSFDSNPRWHTRIKKGLIEKSSTLWMQTAAIRDFNKDKIDIFWATEQIAPINLPRDIKLVLTVHDLTWLYYPQMMKWYSLIFHKIFFKKSIKKNHIILADSNSTAEDIKNNFPCVNSNKIKVVYPATDEAFMLLDKTRSFKNISEKFNIFKKYILYVGTVEPRKNLEVLVKAYSLLSDEIKKEYQVLIAGRIGWGNSRLFKLYKHLELDENHVKFLGYVSKEDLVNLYCGASLFVFPSLYEGFGLPILEAMACGLPVICSDIDIFREIAGPAAYFANCQNPESLSQIINILLMDQQAINSLIDIGLQQYRKFSWRTAAEQILSLFN